jgi:hypothetical protein
MSSGTLTTIYFSSGFGNTLGTIIKILLLAMPLIAVSFLFLALVCCTNTIGRTLFF